MGLLNDFKRDDATLKREQNIVLGKNDFRAYCNLINPEFFKQSRKYQTEICQTMQAMYEKRMLHPQTGKPLDILIINLPPGFGKSYTDMVFATWVFGQDIRNKIISISYNSVLSVEFAKGVRDMIQDEEMPEEPDYYTTNSFFPGLAIKAGDGAMEKWSLDGRGVYRSYLATSFDGSLTGMRGNVVIIDDPIKNHKEAVNDAVKTEHWRFFTGTLPSRVLPGGLIIVIQTRWATDDLAGRIIADKEYGQRCHVLEMRALSKDDETGISLCEDLYPTDDLQAKRRGMMPELWSANFQQIPVDLKGALYTGFKTYPAVDPDKFQRIIAYVDTADEGADYLCAIIAGVIDKEAYILDIYYTDESMEITEPETARRLDLLNVREGVIESNNGGRGFARNIITKLKARGNRKCAIKWFHQSKNKNARILVNSASVMEQVYMPEDWEQRFPTFARDIRKHQKKGKNEHDDAADTLTGIVEIVNGEIKCKRKVSAQSKTKLFGGRL